MSRAAASDDETTENLPIIDEVHLATFTDGDAALEDELGELFVTTALGYLKRMKEALRHERPWSAEAHALKGASGNLGARRVAALARQAEFLPPSPETIDDLQNAIDDVKAFFTKREL